MLSMLQKPWFRQDYFRLHRFIHPSKGNADASGGSQTTMSFRYNSFAGCALACKHTMVYPKEVCRKANDMQLVYHELGMWKHRSWDAKACHVTGSICRCAFTKLQLCATLHFWIFNPQLSATNPEPRMTKQCKRWSRVRLATSQTGVARSHSSLSIPHHGGCLLQCTFISHRGLLPTGPTK